MNPRNIEEAQSLVERSGQTHGAGSKEMADALIVLAKFFRANKRLRDAANAEAKAKAIKAAISSTKVEAGARAVPGPHSTRQSLPDGMKECPFCAEMVQSRAIKCKHCASILTCPLCAEAVDGTTGRCRHCGGATSSTSSSVSAAPGFVARHPNDVPDPVLMCVCSVFIPGLGQIFLGQVAKGVVMFLASLIAFVLLAITIIGPLVWVYFTGRDALLVGRMLKAGKPVGKWDWGS